MSFPLGRSWQTSNLLTANAHARALGGGISLAEPPVDAVSVGRPPGRESRPSLSLGAKFQRSTARRACLPNGPQASPPATSWVTLPTTALSDDPIPSQISRPSSGISIRLRTTSSPPRALAPSVAARSKAKRRTSVPHTTELVPRINDINASPSSPAPLLDAHHLDAPDLQGRHAIHVRMPRASTPLLPTPIHQPRPPRTEELLPRDDDPDTASSPQLIAKREARAALGIDADPGVIVPLTTILRPPPSRTDKLHPRNDVDASSYSAQLALADAFATLNHSSVRAARAASSPAARLTPPAGATRFDAPDTFDHRTQTTRAPSAPPAAPRVLARRGSAAQADATSPPHARSHATQDNRASPAPAARGAGAAGAHASPVWAHASAPAHTRPPPAACWRFLEQGARQHVQSSSPGNVAKVQGSLARKKPQRGLRRGLQFLGPP